MHSILVRQVGETDWLWEIRPANNSGGAALRESSIHGDWHMFPTPELAFTDARLHLAEIIENAAIRREAEAERDLEVEAANQAGMSVEEFLRSVPPGWREIEA